MGQTPNGVRVLQLPGWQGSGLGHWQSRWEALYGDLRVEQHDWNRPLRGDWLARLDATIVDLAPRPVVLVAHSLGCALVAAWAAHSSHTARVRGTLLVAPPDLGRQDTPAPLPGWAPIVRERLPFEAVVVASRDDPWCAFEHAQALAHDWGARLVDAGACGHINAESALGDWAPGRSLIDPWLDRPEGDGIR
jgi:uncharacterized protein